MKTISLITISLAMLSGAVAAQQVEDIRTPRAPVVGPDIKTGTAVSGPAVTIQQAPAAMYAAPKPTHEPAGLPFDPFADPDLVVFDHLDGSHWAVTGSYKAEFAVGGVQFIPFLGSDAPDNYPVWFRLQDVRVAGEPLPWRKATAQRQEQRVYYDRGPVVELYDVRGREMEQLFRFDALPQRGEIVVAIDVTTSLAFKATDDGFQFLNRLGGVRYGKAVAIDARGERVAVPTTFEEGRIEIRVPAAFVEHAALPLTIDPLVGSVQEVIAQGLTMRDPDVAWDETTGRYLYVWESVRSATDSDVYAIEYDDAGNRYTLMTIDPSPDAWVRPRVANNNWTDRNFVVAQVSVNRTPPSFIKGRMHQAGTQTRGAILTIADPTNPNHFMGNKINPDVGGDPHYSSTTYFTVVWERVISGNDHDIHMKQVTNGMNPAVRSATPTVIDNDLTDERRPAISNSCGVEPSWRQHHTIVYQKRDPSGDEDIYQAIYTWSGQEIRRQVPVDTSPALDLVPTVTSPTEFPYQPAGDRHHLIVWQRELPGPSSDIYGRMSKRSGDMASPVFNLTGLEPEDPSDPHRAWRQTGPVADSDGCRFAVAYVDHFRNTTDLDVRVTTFHFFPGVQALAISESRAWAGRSGSVESQPQITSTYSGGGRALRYSVVFRNDRGPLTNNAIEAVRYDGMAAGGYNIFSPGCIPLPISISGVAALGAEMSINSGGFGLLFGVPRAAPVSCGPCVVAVQGDTYLPNVAFRVPSNVALIGGRFAVQAFDVAPGLPCQNVVGFSDAWDFVVR